MSDRLSRLDVAGRVVFVRSDLNVPLTRDGERVVISDDGRGLDEERIAAKAVHTGLITAADLVPVRAALAAAQTDFPDIYLRFRGNLFSNRSSFVSG